MKRRPVTYPPAKTATKGAPPAGVWSGRLDPPEPRRHRRHGRQGTTEPEGRRAGADQRDGPLRRRDRDHRAPHRRCHPGGLRADRFRRIASRPGDRPRTGRRRLTVDRPLHVELNIESPPRTMRPYIAKTPNPSAFVVEGNGYRSRGPGTARRRRGLREPRRRRRWPAPRGGAQDPARHRARRGCDAAGAADHLAGPSTTSRPGAL